MLCECVYFIAFFEQDYFHLEAYLFSYYWARVYSFMLPKVDFWFVNKPDFIALLTSLFSYHWVKVLSLKGKESANIFFLCLWNVMLIFDLFVPFPFKVICREITFLKFISTQVICREITSLEFISVMIYLCYFNSSDL